MIGRRALRPLVIAGTFALTLMLGQPAAIAAPVVDQTIAGPIGGAEVCVAGECLPEVEGIANVRILIDQTSGTITGPGVTTGSAPGCSANINVAFFATSPGVSGFAVTPTVSFDRTDKNGNIVGSETLGGTPIPLPAVPGTTVPVASVCATLL